MTRIFGIVLAVAFVLVLNSSVSADEGQVSQAQLAELGLGGMELVSDEEGTQVRGKFLWNVNGATYLSTLAALNAIPGVGPSLAASFANTVAAQNAQYAALLPGTIYANAGLHIIN